MSRWEKVNGFAVQSLNGYHAYLELHNNARKVFSLTGMKVLVTGGAGFIGSYLVDRLIRDGYGIRLVDNLSSGRIENIKHHLNANSVELIIGDLKDPQTALKAVGIDAVFHFAANPEVRVSATNPEIHFNENVVVTFNLLEATRKKRVKELVFASSSSVYGEPEEIPVEKTCQ